MEESKEEEIKDLLEKNLEVSEENHEILQSMARASHWSLAFTIIKWVIVMGAALGAYYYFEPVWNKTIDLYRNLIQPTPTASDVKADQTSSKFDLFRLNL